MEWQDHAIVEEKILVRYLICSNFLLISIENFMRFIYYHLWRYVLFKKEE